MTKVSIIASLCELPSLDGKELLAIGRTAEWLEVRADLVGDLDADWLRNFFPRRLLYSLRSRTSGGTFAGSEADRVHRLLQASRGYDLVELEAVVKTVSGGLVAERVELRANLAQFAVDQLLVAAPPVYAWIPKRAFSRELKPPRTE